MDLPLLLNIRCGNFDGRQSTLGLSFSQNTHDDDDDDDDAVDDDDDKFVDGRHCTWSLCFSKNTGGFTSVQARVGVLRLHFNSIWYL